MICGCTTQTILMTRANTNLLLAIIGPNDNWTLEINIDKRSVGVCPAQTKACVASVVVVVVVHCVCVCVC